MHARIRPHASGRSVRIKAEAEKAEKAEAEAEAKAEKAEALKCTELPGEGDLDAGSILYWLLIFF